MQKIRRLFRRQRRPENDAEEQAAQEQQKLEPWRKFERNGGWTNEYRKLLAERIKSYTPYGDVEYSKLVLVGPVGAGKSSFFGSIASIDKNEMSQPTIVGAGPSSTTKKLFQYLPKNNLAGKFRLLDTMGLEETQEEDAGFNIQDIIALMQGHIAPNYLFNPTAPINKTNNPQYIEQPTLKDQVQCTGLVIDSTLIYDVDNMPDVLKKKIRQLQTYILQNDVAVVVILTKIDRICETEKMKLTEIYTNCKIGQVVEHASKLFGIPIMNIYPVQNYYKEGDTEDNVDILLLLALRGMLRRASDRLEQLEDQKR